MTGKSHDEGQNGPTDSCFYQFLMKKLQKKFTVADSMAEIFFCHKTYLLGYEIIDFEGILDVPFFYS